MTETTLLYTLSTLAQTCAALAAFVGAVGLYRLQTLRQRRAEAEREFRALAARVIGRNPEWTLIDEFVRLLERDERSNLSVQAAMEALERWRAFVPRMRSSRLALIVFETWNLLVIGASLAGFNYVTGLVTWTGTFWAIWAAAVGTVVVTLACVVAWTAEGRRFSETLRNWGNRLRERMRL